MTDWIVTIIAAVLGSIVGAAFGSIATQKWMWWQFDYLEKLEQHRVKNSTPVDNPVENT